VADESPSSLGVFALPLRFPGQTYDAETRLHYNHFRDYNAGTGSYVESDPIGLRGGSNSYLYARAAPTQRIDRHGLATSVPEAGHVGDLGGKAAEGLAEELIEWLSQPNAAGQNAAAALCKSTQGRWLPDLTDRCTTNCLAQQQNHSFTWLAGWLLTCIDSCVNYFPKCNKKPSASGCPMSGAG
jgi:RHS repeat-associated protein